MKKIYFCLALITITGIAKSQSLNSNNFPEPGDVYKYFFTDTLGIVAGPGGTSQVWNFEDLNVDTVLQIDNYLSPITTTPPVTGTTTVIGTDTTGYNFFKNTASDYAMLGFSDSGNVTVVVYSNPMTLLTFPFSFGNTYTDNFAFSTTFQSFNVNATGTINSTIDGSGNLLLPQGAFINVIRIKYTVVTNLSAGFLSVTQTQNIYEWYDPNKKLPLLHIENTITTDPFGGAPTEDKRVWLEATGPAGLMVKENNANFSLAPNPAKDQVNIKLGATSLRPTHIVITNSIGQKVYENSNIDDQLSNLNISTSDLEKGVYFVSVIQNNQTFTKKMVVQ
jgi:hypothetical protein